jgi:hypothetical protein
MLEVVIGSIVLFFVLLSGIEGYIGRSTMANKLKDESELLKENLNHLAGAIISLSELLDDADQVIENISQVPTVGEMIQQAIVGFVTQKVQDVIPAPMVEPMQEVISEKFASNEYGKEKTRESKEEIPPEIQEGI